MLFKFTPARVSHCDDASMPPSGLHTRLLILRLRSGVRVKSSRPLSTSLIFIERLFVDEASRLPSWLKANAEPRALMNAFGCSGNERGSLAVATSQSLRFMD